MAKLKNIIKQLSAPDFQAIFNSLMESNADKSAQLLKFMREKQMSDVKIMEELGVNSNAYYTLRSRLNQKIEEYLLQQMENPRTDLLKKVANIHEIIFTKKKAIAIATLKKLEKELLDYDLSNELTVVYKTLKKLHLNTPDNFTYSQQYNRHVAFMLAVDKAEDLLSEYFKKFGVYSMTGSEIDKLELGLLSNELSNISKLYSSHRLYVYQACVNIFHRLFVEQSESEDNEAEPIEDIIKRVEDIFEEYYLDSIYYNLKVVISFLKFEYYNHIRVFKKAENYFEEVNDELNMFLSNYSLYTYPSQFLLSKLDRYMRLGIENELYEENKEIFLDYIPDLNDVPAYITYITFRSLSCYYVGKYEEAAHWLNNMLNELSLKKFVQAQIEIKLLLTLQYCLMKDYELFNQSINSLQRQIRMSGKDEAEHVVVFIKILKTILNDNKKDKSAKMIALMDKLRNTNIPTFSPIKHIKLDDKFIGKVPSFALAD